MIAFPPRYPYIITNTTGGVLCGIAPSGVKDLGPEEMEATHAFYSSHAEEAYTNLLNGNFSAVDGDGGTLSPHVAAASFTNMRTSVMDFSDDSRIYQVYTRFGKSIAVPGFFDKDGSTGASGQVLASGALGVSWTSVNGSTGPTGNYAYYTQFTSASLSSGAITITHNLNSEWVTVEVYDDSQKKVIPSEVQKLSANTSRVSLEGLLVVGTWTGVVLSAGGSPPEGGSPGVTGSQGTTGTQGIQGFQGTTGAQGTGVEGGHKITISTTAPVGPAVGDVWIDIS